MLASRLERLHHLYVRGEIDELEYDRQSARLQQQLRQDALPFDIDVAVGRQLADFGSVWALADAEQKRRLVRKLLRAVYVRGQAIVRVEPRREFATLFERAGRGLAALC